MLGFLKKFFEPKESKDIAIASDHRGVQLRHRIIAWLEENGRTVIDCGPETDKPVDYPDMAETVCNKVMRWDAKQGILICGTGIGMSMAANKIMGIRAARCVTAADARFSRLHNNANILCLGENAHDVETVIHEFLSTGFENGGRHERRVNKIMKLEVPMWYGSPV